MKHAELALLRSINVNPSAFDFSGRWSNELKSYMELKVSGGAITGTYVSAVSDNNRPTPPFPLYGSTVGDLIGFTVNWGNSITSWIGHGVITGGRSQILTLWHLVKAIADETDPKQQWKTVLTGADEFFR